MVSISNNSKKQLRSSGSFALLLLLSSFSRTLGFELPKVFGVTFPKISFNDGAAPWTKPAVALPGNRILESKKEALITAISNTSNGKTATPEQQTKVLKIVRDLETNYAPIPTLLTDNSQASKSLLNGTWYLQYTSSSTPGQADDFPDAWKPEKTVDDANIRTVSSFKAKGSITAGGIKVETANRVVQQILDLDQSRVINDVELDWGRVKVEGRFRPSASAANRAVVAFDTVEISVNNPPVKLNFGFVFQGLALIRQTDENGWLETTFVDKDMRIGRGNKGTMFVLTRDPDVVEP